MQRSSSLSKMERNAMEKKRRVRMKELVSTLGSLIATKTSKERLPLPVLLYQATAYIKQLKEGVEKLRQRMEELRSGERGSEEKRGGSVIPVVVVRDIGSGLEVNLVTGLSEKLMLGQLVTILQEEGAQVVSASYSTSGNKIFYAIHSQAIWSRIGIDASRVHDRLKEMVSGLCNVGRSST